jgi:hypothetical protein
MRNGLALRFDLSTNSERQLVLKSKGTKQKQGEA